VINSNLWYVGVSSGNLPAGWTQWSSTAANVFGVSSALAYSPPNGLAADLDAECRHYEAAIQRFGGIDLQLLGIGKAGHIGFNEPLSALRSRTRVKALTPTTLKQNAEPFGGEDRVPRRAITMGVGTILECRRCILLAAGPAKAAVIAQAVEGPITSMVTATALQLHPRCTVIVDEPAAAELKEQDYYRWIFENEPEWQEYR